MDQNKGHLFSSNKWDNRFIKGCINIDIVSYKVYNGLSFTKSVTFLDEQSITLICSHFLVRGLKQHWYFPFLDEITIKQSSTEEAFEIIKGSR